MKIKTALKLLLFPIILLLFFTTLLHAQIAEYVEKEEYEVIVSANINVDLYSQVTLVPPTVEIREPANVNIRLIRPDGTPRPGRRLEIYIQDNSTGVSITQPVITDSFGQATGTVSSSIPGSYTVCVKDVTDGLEIMIEDCETLYVIPVPTPTMLPEPEYTKGDSNIVLWSMTNSNEYEYYVQVSTSPDFSTIQDNSGWISNLAYKFDNLEDGQMYFYRAKARNEYGGESAWSNTVFSVQDGSGPEIKLISISDIEDNTNVDWVREFTIYIKYRITDNIEIADKEFWCVGRDLQKYDCFYTAREDGDFWEISVRLKNLEKTSSGNLFPQYTFCVEARDTVDNVTRNCEAILEIPVETPEEEIPPPVIPRIPIISKIRERIERIIEEFVLKPGEMDLIDVTVTTTTANVFVGFGLLLTSIGYLPHLLFQLFLGLLSLLGFRKKGNVNGYVYDSVTKEPIPQAIVRIYNEVHELIWTSVTDKNGYFRATEVKDGEYYIKVTARNYTFPSKIVFGKTDFPLENVYHGDPFLSREEKIPNFAIPMDSEDISTFRKNLAIFSTRSKFIWKILHSLLFVFGLIFSLYALSVSPVWWNYLIVALYIPSLISLLYSVFNKKGAYGVVKDTEGNLVEGAIIGLNENQFDKLVSKRVTDKLGRYKFVVSKGSYSLSVLNSDLKLENEEEYSQLVVEKDGGNVLAPKITVKRLEDDTKEEDVIEPLEEL